MATWCFAQKADPAPNTVVNGSAIVRPVIFQRNAPAVQATASASTAQLSQANLRLASDVEVDDMELTLGSYVKAFENLNLAQVKQVWPDLDRPHATAFKDVFAGFKGASATPHLVLQCALPKLTADMANMECSETIIYQTAKGKGKSKELGPVRISIQMKDESGHWLISDMKGSS